MKTVKKVIAILEEFEKPLVELSVSDLVEISGLNSSTVYRICAELEQKGYLSKDGVKGKYRLGHRFIKYYNSMNELNNLKQTALIFMQKLSKEINESVSLSIQVGSEITDIAAVVSPHKLQLLPREGENLPLYCTSAGKIFLSQMDSESLKRVLRIKGIIALTTNTLTDFNLLNKELAVIRKEGLSFDDEEFELGIRSVAAQIKGANGSVLAALAVIGPSVRISVQKMKAMTPAIKICAEEISRALGYHNGH